LGGNAVGEAQQQAGAALGALIAANSPALRDLRFHASGLSDAGMSLLVDALPRNTHLEMLLCTRHGASAAFVRERLLPALRPGLICAHS
jgi:hypothetical protein